MYRAWANVLLPPKPALKPQSDAHDIGRFGYLVDPPVQLAGPAIEGRTKIGEHGVWSRPCVISQRGAAGCPPPTPTEWAIYSIEHKKNIVYIDTFRDLMSRFL